ncbi:MAG: HPF/RaiA family ribosome-associated protein [Thermoguttaceae bacterium]
MKTHWTFRGCDDQLKSESLAYWAKKEPRLERVLERFPEELRDLDVHLHRHPSLDRYEGRLILHLPTGTLVAEDANSDVRPVLDQLTDFLVASIKRHKERLRRDWLNRRRNRRRQGLDAIGQTEDVFGASLPALEEIPEQTSVGTALTPD